MRLTAAASTWSAWRWVIRIAPIRSNVSIGTALPANVNVPGSRRILSSPFSTSRHEWMNLEMRIEAS